MEKKGYETPEKLSGEGGTVKNKYHSFLAHLFRHIAIFHSPTALSQELEKLTDKIRILSTESGFLSALIMKRG